MRILVFVVTGVLYFVGLATGDEKQPTLTADAKSIASLPETAWLSEPMAVTLEAKELGGKKDDKLRLALRFRPGTEPVKGQFRFGLVDVDAKDGTVIHRPFGGTYEVTEKDGKRVLALAVKDGAKKQNLLIPYSIDGKKLMFPKGVAVEGWEAQGVKVYLATDKAVNLSPR